MSGLRLPFEQASGAHANVAIDLYHDEEIHEAEVSAANGMTTGTGEGITPFFDVKAVYSFPNHRDKPRGDVRNVVEVDTSQNSLNLRDVVLFHANINEYLGISRHTGQTTVGPIQIGSSHDEGYRDVPVLLTWFESGRGTHVEFEKGVIQVVRSYSAMDAVLKVETVNQQHRAVVTGDAITVSDASNAERDLIGPSAKSNAETYYDAVVVDHDSYESWVDTVGDYGVD